MIPDTGSLTIATVLYGGADVLAFTLPTWAAAAEVLPVRFVFIDNSEDKSAREVVEAQHWPAESVRYVHSGSNVGFASAANRAISESDTSAVLLLNADVMLRSDQIERILALGRVSSPVAISLETRGHLTAGIEVNPIGWFSDRPIDSRRPCLGPSGGAALFQRDQFLKSGGFTDQLFAWGEDAALSLRLWANGVSTATLDLRLEHLGGHSVSSVTGQRRKAFWLARNRMWILRAQYSSSYRWTIGSLMVAMAVANGVRKIPSRTSAAYFRGMMRGLLARPPWTVTDRITLKTHLRYLRSSPPPVAATPEEEAR